ncbi:hypothetical protein [Microbacterium gubbeenense]|uniref:hypothetical protein n=1 Tax=Microbacterium gubbeenense TaxID=159896 RepID=UPI003F9D53C0
MTTQKHEVIRQPLNVAPGSTVSVRDADWLVTSTSSTCDWVLLEVTRLSDLVRDTRAAFYQGSDEIFAVGPRRPTLRADSSPGYRQARLWLELGLRLAPLPLAERHLSISTRILTGTLRYQRNAVRNALSIENLRPRIFLVVGVGKTIENAGLSVAGALTRRVTTQGALLGLALTITRGDGLAAYSFVAALMRRLREPPGGDLNHFRIVQIVEPVRGDAATADALLVHDSVPGCTGYVAEPERAHELRASAWRIVCKCEFRGDGPITRHRCPLRYAVGQTAIVSCASVEQALSQLLRATADDVLRPFDSTEEAPDQVVDESAINQLFRGRSTERAKAARGTLKERPGAWGSNLRIAFPDDHRIWELSFTTPDSMLEQHGGAAASIAVYSDGFAFHARPQNDRLADDVKKRAAVREAAHHVRSVTWAELHEKPLDRSWSDESSAAQAAPLCGILLVPLQKLTQNPAAVLMEWMQGPGEQDAERAKLARVLPLMLPPPPNTPINYTRSPALAVGPLLRAGAAVQVVDSRATAKRSGALAYVTRFRDQGVTGFALVFDSHPEALSANGLIDDWRLWLHQSNVVRWRSDQSGVELLALSQVQQSAEANVGPVNYSVIDLSAEWQDHAENASRRERELILELANAGVGDLRKCGWSSAMASRALSPVDQRALRRHGASMIPELPTSPRPVGPSSSLNAAAIAKALDAVGRNRSCR